MKRTFFIFLKDMTLDNATILLKALFNEYFEEPGFSYTIVRQFSDEKTVQG